MLASVLGMALSIEFGIAATYALGACFYVVCAVMIVASRQANRMGVSEASPVSEPGSVRHDEVTSAADPAAPSICPTQIEPAVNITTAKSSGLTVSARADEVIE
jgi:hypothetical protein